MRKSAPKPSRGKLGTPPRGKIKVDARSIDRGPQYGLQFYGNREFTIVAARSDGSQIVSTNVDFPRPLFGPVVIVTPDPIGGVPPVIANAQPADFRPDGSFGGLVVYFSLQNGATWSKGTAINYSWFVLGQ